MENDSGSYVVYHKQNALSYIHFYFKKIERSNGPVLYIVFKT